MKWKASIAIWVVKFPKEGLKLDTFLSKHQPTPRKVLYFVNRHGVESSKIKHHFRKEIVLRIENVKKKYHFWQIKLTLSLDKIQ